MNCTDGSRERPNYHCRTDGKRCHLPRGGVCYKLNKVTPNAKGSTEVAGYVSISREVLTALVENTYELVEILQKKRVSTDFYEADIERAMDALDT